MTSPFDVLTERLGPDRINAYTVEHGLDRDDPGWVGAVQMLPLLDAIAGERERIEAAVAYLPEAMLALAPEIAQAIADAVQGGVVAAVAEQAADAIRDAITEGIDAHLEPIRTYAESVHEVLRADSSALDSAARAVPPAIAELVDQHDVLLAAIVQTRNMLVTALGIALIIGLILGWLLR